ncbi:MAG: PAS domain S-box protein, partial [Pseudobdellovibrionaceae bacterium]|nr:PAS domain S-box protein [Pseudobdellovibrionaceae bacterium]
MGRPIRVLMVEDSYDDAELIAAQLERGGFDPAVKRIWTKEAMEQALSDEPWDIVLSDSAMPRFTGRAALELLKACGKDIPFIMISGTIGDDLAVACMKAGASDYLMKDNLSRLAPAVERELTEFSKRRDRERIEKELKASEERFRLMVEQVRDYGIVTTDPDGYVTDWNPSLVHMTGLMAEEMIGRNIALIFTLKDKSEGAPENERRKASELGSSENIRWHLRKDGGRFWGKGFTNAIRDPDGTVRGFSMILRDETANKRRDDAQKILDQFTKDIAGSIDYHRVLKYLADAIVPELAEWCIIDVKDKVGGSKHEVLKHVDPSIETILQYARSLYPPGNNTAHPVGEVLKGNRSVLIEAIDDDYLRSIAKDERHLELLRQIPSASAIIVPLMAHGSSFGTVTIGSSAKERLYDQADQRLLEELARRGGLALDNARLYLEAKEANRLKDEFIAAVSHELRTPLNAILGFSELIMFDDGISDEVRESIEAVDRNAKAQHRLVEDLLDISKIISGKMSVELTSFDLGETLR